MAKTKMAEQVTGSQEQPNSDTQQQNDTTEEHEELEVGQSQSDSSTGLTEQKQSFVIERHETLREALLYAQSEYPVISHNQKVDYTTKEGRRVKYSYADLAQVIDAIYPCLHRHGLVMNHKVIEKDDATYLLTKLRHVHSDDSDEVELKMGATNALKQDDLKVMAGNITFLRRYAIGMLTGCVTEEDNDAERVSRGQEEQQPEKPKPPTAVETLKKKYFALLDENKVFADDKERKTWQVLILGEKKESTTTWTKPNVDKAIKMVNWRIQVGVESDALLAYMNKTKAKKHQHKIFLTLMKAKTVTDIKDVNRWKVAMAIAGLSGDNLPMGHALLRAAEYDGLLDKFMEVGKIDKIGKMAEAQVDKWEPFLSAAIAALKDSGMEIDGGYVLTGKKKEAQESE